jgi:hypothetical protein
VFLSKQNFEEYRNNAKKDHEKSKIISLMMHIKTHTPWYLYEKMKGRAHAVSTANDERC